LGNIESNSKGGLEMKKTIHINKFYNSYFFVYKSFIVIIFLCLAMIPNTANSQDQYTDYVLDHWIVAVAEEWIWGHDYCVTRQEWHNVSAEARTFPFLGTRDDGRRTVSGSLLVSLPDRFPYSPFGFAAEVDVLATVLLSSNDIASHETGFLEVGFNCMGLFYEPRDPCSTKIFNGSTCWGSITEYELNAGNRDVYIVAQNSGIERCGDTLSKIQVASFKATGGWLSKFGGNQQRHYRWTVTATAVFKGGDLIPGDTPPTIKIAPSGTLAVDSIASEKESVHVPNPIVILGPPTYHDRDPGVARASNVSPNGFTLRFQEWAYLDGYHSNETIPYMIHQIGHNKLKDGTELEAGIFDLNSTGKWIFYPFKQVFSGKPHVFLTVQTENGAEPVAVRVKNVNNTGFEAALFEEEDLMDGHTIESVGYFAIYNQKNWGTIELNNKEVPYLLQKIESDHRFIPVLASNLMLEEERSKDMETAHPDELVDILVLKNLIFAQVTGFNSPDTISLRQIAPEYDVPMEWGLVRGIGTDWVQVPLAKEYFYPIVVVKPSSSNDLDPGVFRLQSPSRDHFKVRYQEWAYLDNSHKQEDAFYMVSEIGTHSLGQLIVKAGKFSSSANTKEDIWESINLTTTYTKPPGVFSSVQTSNGNETVKSRVRNLTESSFDLALELQEANLSEPVKETLGWIAIGQGYGATSDGRTPIVAVGKKVLSSKPANLSFPPYDCRFPVVIAEISSVNEVDPVFIRYLNPTHSSIDLFIQEEQSNDFEQTHSVEDSSVFICDRLSQNLMPIADGGPETIKTLPGDMVILDGTDSVDTDDGIAYYQWAQVSGPIVNLENAHSAKATFTAPKKRSTLKFEFTVTDKGGNSSVDIVNVEVLYLSMPWLPLLLFQE
jgi:hypothetical protein